MQSLMLIAHAVVIFESTVLPLLPFATQHLLLVFHSSSLTVLWLLARSKMPVIWRMSGGLILQIATNHTKAFMTERAVTGNMV